MIALSPKRFETFPQYTPPPCGASMANPCPRGLVTTKLAIISRMKPISLPTLATVVALMVFALPSAAKTKVDVKDAQGKDVGSIIVMPHGSGVSLKLMLHDLPPGEHAIHFHQ